MSLPSSTIDWCISDFSRSFRIIFPPSSNCWMSADAAPGLAVLADLRGLQTMKPETAIHIAKRAGPGGGDRAVERSAVTSIRRATTSLFWEEPFRVFFPVGLLLGAVGVLLWPLFFWGALSHYPGVIHARLMTEGFVGCFIFGFLGTAGPRVMSVPPFSRGEVVAVLVALVAACGAHALTLHAVGDGLFVISLLCFLLSLAKRFRHREDSPPPPFVLVGLGLANGFVGAALLTWSEATQSAPTLYRLGASFLNIGFGLLPLLGVAPFFLRRLLDFDTDTPRASGTRTFALALLLAVIADASFVAELATTSPFWGWLRATVALAWLALTLPMSGKNALAASLRMGLVTLPAGLALIALLPAYRVSALHVLFIGGFALSIYSVATRVVLGHSGKLGVVTKRRGWLGSALFLLVTAMISRFVADFVATRNEHLLWGALVWLVGAAMWAVLILPHVRHVAEEEN
jgi:uncharacterized protein involved in response to NO